MSGRPSGFLLSKAIQGFENFSFAGAVAPGTVVGYLHSLGLFQKRVGDVEVGRLDISQLRDFLAWLRTDYRPRRFGGGTHPLSPKTLRNHWVVLSSFFDWLHREFGYDDLMIRCRRLKFKRAPVRPFPGEQIEALLEVAARTEEVRQEDKRTFAPRRPTARRDVATFCILLDSGLRASEAPLAQRGRCRPKDRPGHDQARGDRRGQGWQGSHGLFGARPARAVDLSDAPRRRRRSGRAADHLP